jgi:hypothetical protein
MTIARTVFCLSLAATLFWVFGFAAERITGTEPSFLNYSIPALVVTAVFAFAVFRAWPRFLRVDPGSMGRFLRGIAVWTVAAYVVGAVALGGLAYWLLDPGAESSETMRGEASLAAYILALWFPLWFAPAVGLSVGWWHAATNVRSNPTIDRDARKSGARPSL